MQFTDMKAVQHNWYGIKASAFPISHSVLLSASMHQSAAGVAVMRVLLMTVSMAFLLAGLQTLQVQTAFAVSVGVCVPLSSNSFCSDILSSSYRLSVYIPTDVSIAISYWTSGNVSDVCQSSADELIGSVAPTVWSAVEADSSCMNSLAKYFCALSYPSCKYTNNATLVAAAGNPPKLAIPSFPNSTECMNTFNSCKAYAPFLSMFPAVIGALFTNPLQTCGASTYPVNLLATSLPTVIQEAIETAVIPFEDFIPQNVPRPQCVRFNSTSCGELIDYEIYQPAQLSTQFNELAPALMDAKLEQFSYLYYTATVATNCITAMKKQLCTRSFLRCQRTVIQNSFGVAIATAVNELTTGPIPPTAQNISAAIIELATLLQQLAVPVSALQVPFPMLPCQTTCTYFNDAACPQFIQYLKASTTSPLESQVLSAALGTNCSSVGTYLQATQQCGSSNGNNQILFPAQPDFPDSTSLLAAPLVLSVSLQFAAAVGVPVAVLNLTQPIQLPISLMSQCNDVGIHLQFGATVTNLSAYSDSQPIQISVVCPPPLVNWDSSDCAINGGSCALPCPLPIFSPSEMVSISRVYVVCIFVSLVSSTFFVVTWLLFHEKRKQTYVINFAIIAWILAFEKTISIYEVNGNIDDMMKIGCKNNCQSWGFGEHAYCTFQGVMSHILVISLACWFCVLSADLWLKVRLNFRGTQRQNEVKNILAFAVGYGTSFITLIIALGLREFGATGTLPFCFASTASGDVDIATAYAPSLFMCLLGFCFMADVLYLLFRNAMNMTSTHSGGKRVSRWSVHLRPLFFQFQILCILLFFEADRFWNVQYASDIERETATWVRCLLSGGSTDSCGEVPDNEKPNRPLYYLVVIAAGGIGAIASFTHCTNPDVYRLWYALLFRCETSTVFGGSKHSRSSSHTNLKDANSTNTPKKSITVNQTSNASIRARGPSGLELGQTTVVPVSVGNTPNVLTPVNARGSKNNPHSHNLELKSSDSTQQQPWQLPAVQDDMKIVRQQLRRTGPSSVTVLQDTAVVRSSLPSPVPLSADLAGGVVSGVKNRNEAVRVSTSQTSPKNHI